jgi:hypothetical protein
MVKVLPPAGAVATSLSLLYLRRARVLNLESTVYARFALHVNTHVGAIVANQGERLKCPAGIQNPFPPGTG